MRKKPSTIPTEHVSEQDLHVEACRLARRAQRPLRPDERLVGARRHLAPYGSGAGDPAMIT